MFESSIEILKKIENNGFKAYIVGGFVRDYILGNESNDVDICTNAKPMDIKSIFPDIFIPNEEYGSITVIYNKIRYEITTFRKEYNYINNRRPEKIVYIDDLKEDLLRRDFTINTLCINSDGKIIDLLNSKKDVESGIIKTVGNSYDKFNEDSLRILRAVRFATVLNFKLDDEVCNAIKLTKKYLKNISFERKKCELDKIFVSKNAEYGVQLIKNLELDLELEIYNINDLKVSSDLLGIWSSIDVSDKYPFNKNEKYLISKIKEVKTQDNYDNKVLYKYGPYVNKISAYNKGLDKDLVVKKYNDLPIKVRNDINISSDEIIDIVRRKPGSFINSIYIDLETKILDHLLINDNNVLKDYVKLYYGGD